MLLAYISRSYNQWIERAAPQEEYENFGCVLLEDKRIEVSNGDAKMDITKFVDDSIAKQSINRDAFHTVNALCCVWLKTASKAMHCLFYLKKL